MMNNNGFISEVAGVATIFICVMTFITFMITVGAWEASLWESDLEGASIIGCNGYWGEDIVVTYTDNTTESVKGVSNNYWNTMSIRNDGSKPISMLQYCINAKIPSSETFDIRAYECMASVVSQDDVVLYRITYTYVSSVPVEANEWTRVVTVSLDVQSVSSDWNDGIYRVSFENAGTIEGIGVPDGRSIDIVAEDGVVSFLI